MPDPSYRAELERRYQAETRSNFAGEYRIYRPSTNSDFSFRVFNEDPSSPGYAFFVREKVLFSVTMGEDEAWWAPGRRATRIDMGGIIDFGGQAQEKYRAVLKQLDGDQRLYFEVRSDQWGREDWDLCGAFVVEEGGRAYFYEESDESWIPRP